MKKLILLFALILICCSSFVFYGCSDDETSSVIAAATAQGWIYAYANLYPYVYYGSDNFYISKTAKIDSVKAGDSLCYYGSSYWYVYGDNVYDYFNYSNNADTNRFVSGDTFDVTYYTSNGIATGSVVLLHTEDDRPVYISPVSEDTLSLGTALEVVWNDIPNAEWYGIYYRYYKDSAGTYINNREYAAVTDTTFTIPGVTNIYNGYYWIYVAAATGPMPGDAPNISGANWSGELNGESYSQSIRVYFGTGDPTPVGNQDENDVDDMENFSVVKQIKEGHQSEQKIQSTQN